MDLSYVFLAIIVGVLFFKIKGMLRSPAQLDEIRKAIENGAVVVDVRSPSEFASSHVPGARNVPLGASTEALRGIGPLDTPVVVYCASGTRSAMAARKLRGLGFQVVHDLGPMANAQRLGRSG